MLKAGSGEVVDGWPVNIAHHLNTAPIVTRLYPLDLILLVSMVCVLSLWSMYWSVWSVLLIY